MRRAAVAALALAAGCTRGEPGTDARSSDASTLVVPHAPAAAEGTAQRVEKTQDVPLIGFRVDARPGDWMLQNAGQVAVVDAHGGRIVDFGTAGHDDALVALEPAIYAGLDDVRAEVVSVGPAPEAPNVLRIERRAHDLPVHLWTFVSFVGPALRIESVATPDAGPPAVATIGERVAWGNVPTWVEGSGFITQGGTFRGEFIAREGLGQAYALGLGPDVGDGRLTARFNAPAAGFHERAHTGEEATLIAGQGTSRRVLWLAHAEGGVGDAVSGLLAARGTPLAPVTLPGVTAERAEAEVTGCEGDGGASPKPYARYALGRSPRVVQMPAWCLRVRITAPGAAPGPWVPTSELAARGSDPALLPVSGTLRWHVTDRSGGTLPARIVVHGLPPTPDPDWGDDPFRGAALDTVATLGDGEIPIAAGRYRAVVSRGFEYTLAERSFTVEAGRAATVEASLDRVVDTGGWISGDLHVHAVPSPDAPTLLDDRVRSLAASGVEVAAATDHNAITDYGPTIHALGADRWLASIVGDEVTTRGTELGHFNVFPLAPGQEPVPYERTTPHDIFVAARAAAPQDRDKVVQVNHPRMGSIGYFELLRLDPGDLAGWRQHAPLFDTGFDALEVFNGDDYSDIGRVETCLHDWYALLDAGLRVTATGNSDSHKMTYHEPGVPRNFVRTGSDDPSAFDERAFIDAVRAGKVVVSSGPFVRLSSGKAEVGDTIDAAEGLDAAEVHVHVEAPAWVDVDTVQLVRRGEVVTTWHPKSTTAAVRLDESTKISLKSGDWIIAIARGSKPMAYLHRAGAMPFSFTNPIFVR